MLAFISLRELASGEPKESLMSSLFNVAGSRWELNLFYLISVRYAQWYFLWILLSIKMR